jgi:hypothetical protein
MIRNEAEYQHASARLTEESHRLSEHRARFKEVGMTDKKSNVSSIQSNPFIFSSMRKSKAMSGKCRLSGEEVTSL